jgi:SAM-dependent methyltransferase
VTYIHGTAPPEQQRLYRLNELTNARFVEFLELEGSETVLEVGSGLGVLAREVAKRVPRGEVTGIEYSRDQLEACGQGSANLRFLEGDAHSLPFEDASFDVVYCRFVLEHVESPSRVLAEMRRVLKPGGRVHVQENNILLNVFDPHCPRFTAAWESFARLQHRLGGDGTIGKKLLPLLRRAGFHDVALSIDPEVHWYGSPSFEAWMENQIANIDGARESFMKTHIMSAAEIDAAIAEARAFMETANASVFFYWNRAKGRKWKP